MEYKTDVIFDDVEEVYNYVSFLPLKGKSILITGASGLIGTYLLACLKPIKDVDIYVMKYQNPLLVMQDRVKLYRRGEITKKFDFIIHAAGYGQPGKFMKDPLATIDVNVVLLLELVRNLKRGGTILYLSSSEVYSGLTGKCKDDMIGTTTPEHPRACYIEAKRCGEAIINLLPSAQNRVGYAARVSLVYGPGARIGDNRVLNEFIQRGLKEKCIRLLDTGEAIRHYLYVRDAVIMLWELLFLRYNRWLKSGDGIIKKIFNVGGCVERITILQLAKLIGEVLDVPVIIGKKGLMLEAPGEVWLDCTWLRQTLDRQNAERGFTRLREGIRKTVDWYKVNTGVA